MAEQPEKTRERIRSVALHLFATRGYDQTSLREIADQLNFTKAALYYHFSSKEELFRSITEPFFAEVEAFLAEVERERSGRARVTRFVHGWVDLLLRNRRQVMLFANNPQVVSELRLELAATLTERLVALLVGPEATMSDRIRVACAVSAMQVGVVYATERGAGDAEVRQALLDSAGAVLAPRPRPSAEPAATGP